MKDQLRVAGGGLAAAGLTSLLGYLIATQASNVRGAPAWPYWLCAALFAAGVLMYLIYLAGHSRSTRKVRSSGGQEYREQVRAIAPRDGLPGRGAELRQMTEFCHGTGSYWWWQAGPWAGKTALLATFALESQPGLTVVSFFITSSYAAQRDSTAFVSAVTAQLEDLLRGSSLPVPAGEGGPGRYRLLLRHAADLLEQHGRRLVLVVDGLDEDHGPGEERPSIASLLPKHCEHGLKVIVASRPHPPIPPDVPADHPLRERDLPHALSASEDARVIRDRAQQELRAMLNGAACQKELLGFIAAAGGGLTVADLAELTGQAPHQISDSLRGAAARVFTIRPGPWTSPGEQDGAVYLMAHETLHAEAITGLGQREVSDYRDRIHAWAQRYAAGRWPPATPGYLLRDYFQMARDNRDTRRVLGCATDPARHERLLHRTGSDTAALAEISAAVTVILAQHCPDLAAMTQLAYYREALTRRNEHMPASLPAVWAALGHPARAEALAHCITNPQKRARALTDVSRALTAAGLTDQAAAVATQAAATARTVTHHIWTGPASWTDPASWAVACQAEELAAAAAALAAAELPEQARQAAKEAEATARSVSLINDGLAKTLSAVAGALAAAELPEQAMATARTLYRPRQAEALALSGEALALVVETLAAIAETLAAAGLPGQARQAAAAADATARSTFRKDVYWSLAPHPDPKMRAKELAAAARALAAAGRPEQARHAAADAAAALGVDLSEEGAVVKALTADGLPGQAVAAATQATATASTITEHLWTDPDSADVGHKAEELAAVARALAAAGLPGQALQAAAQAQAAANKLRHPRDLVKALAAVAGALAAAGLPDQARQAAMEAEAAARSVSRQDDLVNELAAVAGALAAAGLPDQARQAARQAEAIARTTGVKDFQDKARAVAAAARSLAAAGLHDRALDTARSVPWEPDRTEALAAVAEVLAAAGLHDQARDAATEAAAGADTTSYPDALAARRVKALTAAARALAAAGLHGRASETLTQANSTACAIRDTYFRSQALPVVAQAAAAAGRPDEAENIAGWSATALAAVTQELAAAGRQDQAQHAAAKAEAIAVGRLFEFEFEGEGEDDLAATWFSGPHPDPKIRARELAAAAQALAAAGLPDRAGLAAGQAEAAARQAEAAASALTRTDDRTRAQRAAASVLPAVAEALADAGRLAEAEAVARTLTSPDDQARVLVVIGQARAAAGEKAQGDHLIAEAMSIGSWMVPLRLHALPRTALESVMSLLFHEAKEANSD